MAVTLDIVRRGEATKSTTGWEYRRYGLITENTVTHAGAIKEAIDIEVSRGNLPALGSAHPYIDDVTLVAIEGHLTDDPSKIEIVLRYEQGSYFVYGGESQLEIGASIIQQLVYSDSDGTPITVSYTDPNSTTHTIGAPINAYLPNPVIHATRKEWFNPAPKARTYVGTVNQSGWSLDPGAAEGTWMCTGILGRSNDLGNTYIVDYSFQFKDGTWAYDVVYIDPATGSPPGDVTTSNGIETKVIHPVMDFNVLEL